jgi:hypothetical protein
MCGVSGHIVHDWHFLAVPLMQQEERCENVTKRNSLVGAA